MLNDSALALYEGTRETDLVDESIDERILKLLGLDDVFDIDYGTYVSLLKERLVASRNFNKNLSTEEDELLVEEFRKVKGKVGRFKIRKKKITAENLGVTGPVRVSKERFYLTSKAVVPQPAAPVAESSEDVKNISDSLDSILKSLTEQNKLTKKKAEEDRKSDEQSRRLKRESELEKPLKKALGVVKTLIAPFQNILDRIMRFIGFTLLGFLVDKVLKWFTDPENERKIKILGRFLKDWWPSLAFAAGLFLTPLGKFVRTTLTMLRTFVPQMVRFMAAHPAIFLGGTAALATGMGEMWRQGEEKKQIEREAKQRNVKPELVQKELEEAKRSPFAIFGEAMQNISGVAGGGQIKRRRSFFGGGAIDKIVDVNDIAFDGGGGIDNDSGLRITGAGPDTQLIAAQPGEVMISKKAVNKYGANFFLGLNKKAGGTNIPRMVNNIQLAQGGGLIGALGRFLPGTGRVMAPKGMELGYQNKLLGINVGGVNKLPLNQTYSPAAAQRYNASPSAPSTLSRFESGPLTGRHISVPKISTSKPTSPMLSKPQPSSGLNLNLKQNVETIQGAAKRQEQMMRELGVEPSGYVNLRGQPINLGPQSRAMPVGTPNIISRSQTIVLPPQTIASQKPSVPVKTGTQIPDVQTVARIPHREMVIQSLGIGDLMGVG